MFTKKNNDELSLLETSINSAYDQLEAQDAGTEMYANILDKIERLEALRPKKKGLAVSGDALLAAGTNILGIALILNYERIGVVASKAVGFVAKAKM